MPVLYVRLTIVCALAAVIVGLAVTSDWQTGTAVHAAVPLERECASCGHTVVATAQLVAVGGKRWAVCGDACQNEVTANPARFVGSAIE